MSDMVERVALDRLQADCGIPHLPTQFTYHARLAVAGKGPLAYTWQDKPHRLLYDACAKLEAIAAMQQPTPEMVEAGIYLHQHPEFGEEIDRMPLVDADREAGWTETELYMLAAQEGNSNHGE